MSNALIRTAFESRLKTWADAQGIPVAFENVQFTETDGLYLRAFMLPARTSSDDLAGLHRKRRGVYQVSIVCPAGEGAGQSLSIADALDALFPLTAPMAVPTGSPTLNVFITAPMSAAPAIQDAGRYVVPVSATYEAHSF